MANNSGIMFKTLLLSSLITLSVTFFYAREINKLSFSVTEVAPDLYMLKGVGGFTGGNIGLSVGDDGVVIIDDSMPPMLDIMYTAIKSVTNKNVDFIINTHLHGDHIGKNETLGKKVAWIVAHKNLRKHLLDKGISGKDGRVPVARKALPVITFTESMNFHLNGQDALIFHVARTHTDGDAVIYYKSANVIHTGDVMFNKMFPYIDLSNGGSVTGYIQAQKQILALSNDKTVIMPGHDPLATTEDLKSSIAMLEDAKKLITALIEKGESEDEVVMINPLEKYHEKFNWRFITTEKMTRQVYKGLIQSKENETLKEYSQVDGSHLDPQKAHTH